MPYKRSNQDMQIVKSEDRLTRKRFYELKSLIDDFNKDRINLQQFTQQLSSKEAKVYGIMFRNADRDLDKSVFADIPPTS